jgi:hypothetical protein
MAARAGVGAAAADQRQLSRDAADDDPAAEAGHVREQLQPELPALAAELTELAQIVQLGP